MPKGMYDQELKLDKPVSGPIKIRQSSEVTIIEVEGRKIPVPTVESLQRRDKIISNLQNDIEKLNSEMFNMRNMFNAMSTKIDKLENGTVKRR